MSRKSEAKGLINTAQKNIEGFQRMLRDSGMQGRFLEEIEEMTALRSDMQVLLSVWENPNICFYYKGSHLKVALWNQNVKGCTRYDFADEWYLDQIKKLYNTFRSVQQGATKLFLDSIKPDPVRFQEKPPLTIADIFNKPATPEEEQMWAKSEVADEIRESLKIPMQWRTGAGREDEVDVGLEPKKEITAYEGSLVDILRETAGLPPKKVADKIQKNGGTYTPTYTAEDVAVDTYAESLRHTTEPAKVLTTPSPGDVKKPFMNADQIGNLVESLVGGWADFEKANLEIELMKMQNQGQRIHIPKDVDKGQQQRTVKRGFPWLTVGLIAGGVLGVAVLYRMMR